MSTGTAARVLNRSRWTTRRWAETGLILARQGPAGRWEVAFPVQFLREIDPEEKEKGAKGANGARGQCLRCYD